MINVDIVLLVKKACDKLPILGVSDFSITAFGRINLSWFSINYIETGVSVFAHEMGHVVSRAIRVDQISQGGNKNQKFSDSLSCVATVTGCRVSAFSR